VDKGKKPTFDRAMRGLDLLKKHRVEFNALTVVNASNVKHPLKVYDFLRETGSGYIQFIPLVERLHAGGESNPAFAEIMKMTGGQQKSVESREALSRR
jgi:uncharacterized protein